MGRFSWGDAVEAVEPLLETAVIGVDVVDVQVRRRGGRLSRRRHGVEGNPGSTGESGDRLAAIADEMIARRDDSGEGEAHRSAVDLGQDRVEGGAVPVAGDKDGNVVRRRPGCLAVPPRLRAFLGRSDRRPSKDLRTKVSSASTISFKPRGLSLAGARRNR